MYNFNPYRRMLTTNFFEPANTSPANRTKGLNIPVNDTLINRENLLAYGGYADKDDNTTVDTEFGYGEYDPMDPPMGLIGDYAKKYGTEAAQKHFGIKANNSNENGNNLFSKIDNIGSDIYYFLNDNVPFRPFRGLLSAFDQEGQALINGVSSAIDNFKEGNFKKSALNLLGTPLDMATSSMFALPMQYAPSYAMPFKDIATTTYNRFARQTTKDPSFTAIKGHTYSNLNYSPSFNNEAYRIIEASNKSSDSDGGRATLNKDIQNYVNPNLNYGNSTLLFYPFNPVAGYAWTVGRVAPHSTTDYYYTNDTFDNNRGKTQYYLNKASVKHPTDWLRGIGGLFTSWDTEPDEGKQTTRLRFDKK